MAEGVITQSALFDKAYLKLGEENRVYIVRDKLFRNARPGLQIQTKSNQKIIWEKLLLPALLGATVIGFCRICF